MRLLPLLARGFKCFTYVGAKKTKSHVLHPNTAQWWPVYNLCEANKALKHLECILERTVKTGGELDTSGIDGDASTTNKSSPSCYSIVCQKYL